MHAFEFVLFFFIYHLFPCNLWICKQIRNMEHMLQHETLALKEEKNYIRTIQQLKQTREQLSCSLGKQEDIQEALSQKEQVEERLKV